jgi:hypothetical protein
MKNERNIWWLVLSISGISGLGWLTHSYAPQSPLHISIFFLLVFIFLFSLGIFITKHGRFGIILGLGGVGFLGLRFLHLREPLYFLLLLASLLSLELYLRKR